MVNYIRSSENVTEANKEEVIHSIIDFLVSKCDDDTARDIFMAVGVASKIDLGKVQGIFDYNYSFDTFTQLPDSTRLRYLTDVGMFLLINHIWLYNDIKPSNISIDYTVSREELKDLATVLKAQQNRISKDTKDLGVPIKVLQNSVGEYNSSIVIQYILDRIRGNSSENKINTSLHSIFINIVEGDYCVFLKDVDRISCDLKTYDDYVKFTSDLIGRCLSVNASYTIAKLHALYQKLPETLPVAIKTETYTKLDDEIKGVLFKSGNETTDLSLKICILALNNLISRACDYVAIDRIMSM